MRRFHATDARRCRCHVPLENRDSRMTDELRLHSPENPVLDCPGASCNARSLPPRRDVFVLHEYVFMSENPTRDLVRGVISPIDHLLVFFSRASAPLPFLLEREESALGRIVLLLNYGRRF